MRIYGRVETSKTNIKNACVSPSDLSPDFYTAAHLWGLELIDSETHLLFSVVFLIPDPVLGTCNLEGRELASTQELPLESWVVGAYVGQE
jgi:hypothetical protein